MTAPDIESTLTAAFAERHARHGAPHPSLVDVRRRAHRRRSRRAALRASAVVAAGASVLGGTAWVAAHRDEPGAARRALGDGSPPGPTPPTATITDQVGAGCFLDDAQVQAMADLARAAPLPPGDTVPVTFPVSGFPAGCGDLPPVPPGWTMYVITAGDHVAGVAERFCTTTEEIVAGNGWPDLNVPIFPGSLISVPADACRPGAEPTPEPAGS